MLILSRENIYPDRLRNYKIIIDGNCYGEIKNGEVKKIDISSGNHTMYLKIDWCRSNNIEFNISEDEVLNFECGPSARGWKILLSILYITIFRNKYLWIRKKAEVK